MSWDANQYSRDIGLRPTGRNEDTEAAIIARYPVEKHLAGRRLTDPFILLDAGKKIILWYIPECLTDVRLVSFDIYYPGNTI